MMMVHLNWYFAPYRGFLPLNDSFYQKAAVLRIQFRSFRRQPPPPPGRVMINLRARSIEIPLTKKNDALRNPYLLT